MRLAMKLWYHLPGQDRRRRNLGGKRRQEDDAVRQTLQNAMREVENERDRLDETLRRLTDGR